METNKVPYSRVSDQCDSQSSLRGLRMSIQDFANFYSSFSIFMFVGWRFVLNVIGLSLSFEAGLIWIVGVAIELAIACSGISVPKEE